LSGKCRIRKEDDRIHRNVERIEYEKKKKSAHSFHNVIVQHNVQ
jgi:hypothetical protein